MEKLQKEYDAIEKEYLQKFGAHTLDRVILPLTITGVDEHAKEAIKILEQAIETNEPIAQVPPHLWDKIYF